MSQPADRPQQFGINHVGSGACGTRLTDATPDPHGPDRPGVTVALFEALSTSVGVIDVEQVVVRGNLTLALLVTADANGREVIAIAGDVTRIGAPLLPVAVARIAGALTGAATRRAYDAPHAAQ